MTPPKTVLYDGVEEKISVLAQKLNITPQGLRYRLKQNLPLTPGTRKPRFISYEEKIEALDKWMEGQTVSGELLFHYNVIRESLVRKASQRQK